MFARPATFSIGMHFLRQASTAAAAAALFSQVLAAEPAARQFEALARMPEAGQLSVALSSSSVAGGASKLATP